MRSALATRTKRLTTVFIALGLSLIAMLLAQDEFAASFHLLIYPSGDSIQDDGDLLLLVLASPSPTDTATPPPLLADLIVTKSDTPDPVICDNTLTYTIQAHNIGSLAVLSVRLIDEPNANFQYLGFTATRGVCSLDGGPIGGTLNCDLGAFGTGPSAVATIVITGRITAPTDIVSSNTATIDPDSIVVESNEANSSATETTTVTHRRPPARPRRRQRQRSPARQLSRQHLMQPWRPLRAPRRRR